MPEQPAVPWDDALARHPLGPSTKEIVVEPSVVADFFQHCARYPRNEVGALLLGRIIDEVAHVEDLVPAQNVGTAVNIWFTAKDFENADQARKEGQCVLGWAHSHPGYGAFLSATDLRFQTQGQGLFPDYLALVMDPFHRRGLQFAFFRAEDARAVQVPHAYPEACHEA